MSLTILRHESAVLRDNACGDPYERDLWVYTPPGYRDGDASYPLLVCLTAYGKSGEEECAGNRWSPGLPARLDRLIAGGMPPVVVAFPDCFTRWGGSQYLNSSATGRYEDYVCDEIIPYVEKRFRCSGARGFFGRSSGGYGGLRLAMQRPGLVHAVSCQSGDLGFALLYQPDFADVIARLAEFDSLDAWVEHFEAREKFGGADFHVVHAVGMAACYSPDPAAPFGFRFPFEPATNELRPEIWAQWQAHDPIAMVDRPAAAAALRDLDLLFLDCGSRDEWRLHLGLRAFRTRLDALGIAYEAEEFPDTHRSLAYRYDVTIPKLASTLSDRPA